MKNQYFADIRDLFKYDLAFAIIQGLSSTDRFTFIPMLTRNNERTDGQKIDYSKAKAGIKNTSLVEYLQRCLRENRKNILEIREYFLSRGIEIIVHKETEYFDHKKRKEYFMNFDIKSLEKAVICVDPDNGLETSNPDEKHVLYNEIKSLCDRMDNYSVLMIFQYIPRENHNRYIRKRAVELKKVTGSLPLYISDNEIIFYLLTKDDKNRNKLLSMIREYNILYHKLIIGTK